MDDQPLHDLPSEVERARDEYRRVRAPAHLSTRIGAEARSRPDLAWRMPRVAYVAMSLTLVVLVALPFVDSGRKHRPLHGKVPGYGALAALEQRLGDRSLGRLPELDTLPSLPVLPASPRRRQPTGR